jgi:hypothetical protein
MTGKKHVELFQELYQGFSLPLSDLDCGEKCGPYNDYGIPICCDIKLVIPSAYDLEWEFLRPRTDLWRLWEDGSSVTRQELNREIQPGQVLIQCRGYQECQRSFRSITCRAFPFFPYLDQRDSFLGLAYYRDYRDSCWIISNLSTVREEYKLQFKWVFERLFELFPETRENYKDYSRYLRDQTAHAGEMFPILDFTGKVLLVDPVSEQYQVASYKELGSFGPFGIGKELIFPDEAQGKTGRGKKS